MGADARLLPEAPEGLTSLAVAAAHEILLIGGSGFIGRHVARELIRVGHRVAVLARGHRSAVEGAEALAGDRTDVRSLANVLEGRRFDLTVDFLAYDASDIERLLMVPYAALGRYVMISSGQVYLVTEGTQAPYREDDVEGRVMPEPEPHTRDHDEWSYGVGKRRAERAVLGLRGTHGVRGTVLRLPIVQGEGDVSLRLWAYIERMLDGGPLLLPDGGKRYVRHVYAGDVSRAIAWLAGHAEPRGAFYNLAQPDVVTVRELLERIADAVGVAPRFVEGSWQAIRAAGLDESVSPYAGRWSSLVDPSRAAVEWGFVGTRLEDYLPRVVRWHLENRPKTSHPGYAQRSRELELAASLGVAA
jgi:nucleoside-diphosphate-sugar epimerase